MHHASAERVNPLYTHMMTVNVNPAGDALSLEAT
ncbi:MAG: hypothetical protein JWQ64_3283 [Subtercola sp.]|jgi:hypothetical protein|nr:hypothetical protein [Subtercola sp.]